ncbi:hypothetical protein HBI56_106930 [Parastagonospora nodorum]|uniref:Uncharacterized protein n=1 Tax=Phaeosphaeria nodorum (strain SN15 / ATCC MYA-4574 / FGSC 10173) TaxID=321614 RepID=A0A7U2I5X2_PHANO|nr:hypothetical protein HBH56_131960 [Parastagonospora nodorum]QRD02854.1 hypothetical protein JI435_115770 [Parastagonospora nodorum SN15]KAH3927041.1 hypothetical protein HBH54_161260 [Parastagonospora nodorum]KAH3949193.1 hypothetical protein HBH53_086910 [Parastagonospora nodorum]KAH3974831.1 hypothetical protein HBH52_134660 [Parastagonospora nodorum]
MVECPECGAGADLTKDGAYAHCASCNTVFEPGKEGSQYKGSGSGSGDKEEEKKTDDKKSQKAEDSK